MNDLICYQFSRNCVEAGDAKGFLSRFGKFRFPVGKQLQGMMNSLDLMIEGPKTRTRFQHKSPAPRDYFDFTTVTILSGARFTTFTQSGSAITEA